MSHSDWNTWSAQTVVENMSVNSITSACLPESERSLECYFSQNVRYLNRGTNIEIRHGRVNCDLKTVQMKWKIYSVSCDLPKQIIPTIFGLNIITAVLFSQFHQNVFGERTHVQNFQFARLVQMIPKNAV